MSAPSPEPVAFEAMRWHKDYHLDRARRGLDVRDSYIAELEAALMAQAADAERLRSQLEHWKTFAVHAEGEHAAWKKTAIELDEELRALKAAATDGRTFTRADLLEAVKAERYSCSIAVWMTLQDALEPGADDKGLDGWMREAEQRVKNRLAHHSIDRALCPHEAAVNDWRLHNSAAIREDRP